MKKQLDYFEIEGEFGGNQDWFTNIVMHIGGCAAATACDSCIYFTREKGLEGIYPYDAFNLTKDDYKRFSMKMKPYLKPRKGGVDKLELFIDGFTNYLKDAASLQNAASEYAADKEAACGAGEGGRKEIPAIRMEPFSGENSCDEAWEVIRRQIDLGYPIPYLLLRHEDTQQFRDFIWHWFLLVGYEEKYVDNQRKRLVTAATYGEATTFVLDELWETGREPKGGMILYSIGDRVN